MLVSISIKCGEAIWALLALNEMRKKKHIDFKFTELASIQKLEYSFIF